jgi:hypothetical protein
MFLFTVLEECARSMKASERSALLRRLILATDQYTHLFDRCRIYESGQGREPHKGFSDETDVGRKRIPKSVGSLIPSVACPIL